jgi:hypothetical protein
MWIYCCYHHGGLTSIMNPKITMPRPSPVMIDVP